MFAFRERFWTNNSNISAADQGGDCNVPKELPPVDYLPPVETSTGYSYPKPEQSFVY